MKQDLLAGRYQIQREIGHGGMGVVYRAWDRHLERSVALKMIPVEVMHDAELLRRLAREAHAASAINHPGFASVFEFEERGQESFIVYEYVEGPTLRERINQHSFCTEEILDVGIQMADALCAAHGRGIVHRDLKPENVILVPGTGPAGHVKILDLGLAKRLDPLTDAPHSAGTIPGGSRRETASGLLVGTLNYMSPEQLKGETVDSRTDIYALGLVLYEMSARSNPFLGKTPSSTIANILTQEPLPMARLNPMTPDELNRVVLKCLRKNPDERYPSARDLRVDLSNLRHDLATSPACANAEPATAPETPLTIPRALARALVIAIQATYLVMYAIAFAHLPDIERLQQSWQVHNLPVIVGVVALFGAAVRLYLLSAVGFDFADSGRLFRQLFPAVLLLDAVWAASPLLMLHKLGYLTLMLVAGLAFLPFSQRTLMYCAYAPRGGRTSGVSQPLPKRSGQI